MLLIYGLSIPFPHVLLLLHLQTVPKFVKPRMVSADNKRFTAYCRRRGTVVQLHKVISAAVTAFISGIMLLYFAGRKPATRWLRRN